MLDVADNPAQFPEPELQTDIEEGRQAIAPDYPGRRGQSDHAVHHKALVFLWRISKFRGEPIKQQDQFIKRNDPVVERQQEFPEETMFPQSLCYGNRPCIVIGISRFPEPQFELGLEIGLVIFIPVRPQGFHMIR